MARLTPGGHAILRRSLSISLVGLTALLLTLTAPLWIPLSWVFDRLEQRCALPCLVFITAFLAMELLGIAALFSVWLLRPALGAAVYRRTNFRIQLWWTTSLLACAQRLFGLRLMVEGADQAAAAPHILMPRHVSFGDTIFACALVSAPYGIRHRYILKAPLRWDPCIDIAGHRLGCCFVERGQGRGISQFETIAAACSGLADDEGILIYPEGARHTAFKRQERIAQLRRLDPEAVALASRLKHVLYPHIGGTYAAFRGSGFPDALFLAHSGFEGSAKLASIWQGRLRGTEVRLRFWRVASREIPREPEAFARWLLTQWQRMDREVDTLDRAGPRALGDRPAAQSGTQGLAPGSTSRPQDPLPCPHDSA